MTTDLEYLELAAKAVGFQNYTPCDDCLFIETGASRGASGYYWKPFTDDGDALRLAVKLNILVDVRNEYVFASDGKQDSTEWHRDHSDPYAATRRAIVRAAAEIGRNMV